MHLLCNTERLPMRLQGNIHHIRLNDIDKEMTGGHNTISLELKDHIYSMESEYFVTYFRHNFVRNHFEMWFLPKQENADLVYNPLEMVVSEITFNLDTKEIKITTQFDDVFFLKDTMLMRCKHQLAGAVKDFNEFKRL